MRLSHVIGASLVVATLGLGVLSAGPSEGDSSEAAEIGGNQFHGTWWLNGGPPAPRPLILTISRAGTFILEDSIDGGGHTFSGNSFSVTHGSWVREGRKSARALGLRFVFGPTGKTYAVERVRLQLSFDQNFEQLVGVIEFEEIPCTEQTTPLPFTVPVCPDPRVAPTVTYRGPLSVIALRLPTNAPVQ